MRVALCVSSVLPDSRSKTDNSPWHSPLYTLHSLVLPEPEMDDGRSRAPCRSRAVFIPPEPGPSSNSQWFPARGAQYSVMGSAGLSSRPWVPDLTHMVSTRMNGMDLNARFYNKANSTYDLMYVHLKIVEVDIFFKKSFFMFENFVSVNVK